jgi:uncharacterized membrane protein YfcA
MEFSVIAWAAVGLLLAGIVKGATGLGYSSCALPFLVTAFGLKTAIVLVVVPAMASNVAVMWSAGHLRETVSRFSHFYISTIPGICIGILALIYVEQRSAEMFLGFLIFSYSLYSIFRPPLFLAERLQRPLQIPTGLLNGFFTGLTGSQVLPLLPYMLSLKLDPDRFVQAVNLSVTLSAGVMVIMLLISGIMNWAGLGFSVLCVAPALIGIAIGTRVRRLIPSTHFRMMVLIILAIIGLFLIIGR